MSLKIINPIPLVRTDELNIGTISLSDVAAITAYFQQNRVFLEPWEPKRNESFFTYDGWERRVTQLVELAHHKMCYYFLIRENGDPDIKGLITYSNVSMYPSFSAVVGYSLAENAQGKGIMKRSLKATNDMMFERVNLHRISAAYMPHNIKSQAVLESAGFEREGLAKNYLMINGKWQDHVLMSITNPDWYNPNIE
ncbi:30S ribosomal protein S5 alanine N-acetyltransferase [Veronia nyctiphanis]|uniref:30S ribosomal protein S5 alanine N-acetyltransferase n=1 Tax=Veronia nyctiphanis TaxID=1278244 RepID=A0A4Q0YRJ5_9GAMM|nr:GNAT family N-acetyltransferase [Veronia nyctiphanis]RXJ73736.1 30S ribosomal protein S5 alanine N-acetyltransferase [Veronia nyctiphanis]